MPTRHLRWLVVPLLVLPLGWLLFTGFGRDPRDIGSPLIGRPAPAWTLAMLGGGTMSSQDLAGRPYIVNFWASWCPPCVGEHPILAAAHERYGGELEIVGALYQDAPADAEGFLTRYGDAGYPHVIDDGGQLAIEFGVTGPPETFFVDADGIVRAKQFGPLTNALMDEHLASILPGDGRSGAAPASLGALARASAARIGGLARWPISRPWRHRRSGGRAMCYAEGASDAGASSPIPGATANGFCPFRRRSVVWFLPSCGGPRRLGSATGHRSLRQQQLPMSEPRHGCGIPSGSMRCETVSSRAEEAVEAKTGRLRRIRDREILRCPFQCARTD